MAIEQDARKLTIYDARVILGMLPYNVVRSAEYYELGGCDGPSPYECTIAEIDALIDYAKQVRAEIQSLRNHAHAWNADSRCAICGADGLA